MLRRLAFPAILVLLAALPARAQAPQGLDALLGALGMADLVEIMRQEGLAYGDDIEAEMFADRGGARWDAAVARIYDPARMREEIRGALSQDLSGTDLDPLVGFFGSETGKRIVALELSARRALLAPEVEAASVERLEEMEADDDPRLALVERFVETNHLIDANVVGALNANFAFYSGLADGKAFDYEMTEEQMLADVWGQAPEVRDDTREWLLSYLSMAYAPLPDESLEAYIAISETDEGQALNAALFAAFDVAFRRISRELGLAAAQFLAGQDI